MTHSCKHLSQEQKEIYILASKHGSYGVARGIVSDLSGFTMSRDQIHSMKNNVDDGTTKDASDATKLMEFLRIESNKQKIRYIAIYHEVDESSLVSVSKAMAKKAIAEKLDDPDYIKKKKKNKMQTLMTNFLKEETSALNDKNDCTVQIQLNVPDKYKNKRSYSISKPIDKKALGEMLAELQKTKNLIVGNKVLLAVAWCRNDERRLFQMFPEVFMFDITHGTNKEGRPLGISSSCDSNMNVFTPFRVFMPSECHWVFIWIFKTAIPFLIGLEALARVQLVLSNGDSKIFKSFDEVKDEIYPNAMHGLCRFHLVKQSLDRLKGEFHGFSRAIVRNQVTTMKHWVYTWMTIGGIEIIDEFNISYKNLTYWLDEQKQINDKDIVHNSKILQEWVVVQDGSFHETASAPS